MWASIMARLSKAPSIVWVILIPLGLIVLVGGIIGFFWLLSSVEGFASLLMISIGWLVIWKGIQSPKSDTPGWIIAGGIVFYALMGMAIDQPGNWLMNQPIQWLACPAGTTLNRGVDVSNPRPGETVISQDFTCIEGQSVVARPSVLILIAIRLVEYILIAYLFIGIRRLWLRWRANAASRQP
jgi:hypothetical protein